MTHDEAQKITIRIAKGEEFATRFLDDEWGIRPLPGDRFEVWSYHGLTNEHSKEINDESEVTKMLKVYDYKDIKRKLRKVEDDAESPDGSAFMNLPPSIESND